MRTIYLLFCDPDGPAFLGQAKEVPRPSVAGFDGYGLRGVPGVQFYVLLKLT